MTFDYKVGDIVEYANVFEPGTTIRSIVAFVEEIPLGTQPLIIVSLDPSTPKYWSKVSKLENSKIISNENYNLFLKQYEHKLYIWPYLNEIKFYNPIQSLEETVALLSNEIKVKI